jgi:hypothetical protein
MALTTMIEAWGKMKYCQVRALAIETQTLPATMAVLLDLHYMFHCNRSFYDESVL